MKKLYIFIIILVSFLCSCEDLNTTTITHDNTSVTSDTETTEFVDNTITTLETTFDDSFDTEEDEIFSCEETNTPDCKFIVAISNSDGTNKVINSYKKLSYAKETVDEMEDINSVVLYEDTIVHMKYGIVNLKTKDISENTNIYPEDYQGKTYINGNYSQDAIFVDTGTFAVKMQISGLIAWTNLDNVELIPYNRVKNLSYYYVNDNGEINHRLSKNPYLESSVNVGPIDIAPNYLEKGVKYYSFDGHYFYLDWLDLIDDLRSNQHLLSVNSDNPYYNYYQYLPFRSKTNYSVDELNQYLNYILPQSSILKNSAFQFLNVEENYYLNAAMELVFGLHESGLGTSRIAIDKNNIFGMNANDENPYENASGFLTLEDGISYHAHYFLSLKYLNPMHSVYYGTNLGNKHQGINVRYASDAYWGEKIAAHYYRLDKYLGFKDRNFYTIGLTNKVTNVYLDRDFESEILYKETAFESHGKYFLPVLIYNNKGAFIEMALPSPVVDGYLNASEALLYNELNRGFILVDDINLIK